MLHRGHFYFHAIVDSEIHPAIGSNEKSQTYLQHLSYLSSSELHVLLDLQAEHWIYNISLLTGDKINEIILAAQQIATGDLQSTYGMQTFQIILALLTLLHIRYNHLQ